MLNINNFSKLKDLNDVIDERREKEISEIGYLPADNKPVYSLKAKYENDTAEIFVDKEYIKSKGEEVVKRLLFPYLITKLKRRHIAFNRNNVEIGFYRNNRKVKYKNFIA